MKREKKVWGGEEIERGQTTKKPRTKPLSLSLSNWIDLFFFLIQHPFSEILEERRQAYLLSFVLPPFSFYLAKEKILPAYRRVGSAIIMEKHGEGSIFREIRGLERAENDAWREVSWRGEECEKECSLEQKYSQVR